MQELTRVHIHFKTTDETLQLDVYNTEGFILEIMEDSDLHFITLSCPAMGGNSKKVSVNKSDIRYITLND